MRNAAEPAFEGWYYKQQARGAAGAALALIPGKSKGGAFIQAITDKESWNIPFGPDQYRKNTASGAVSIGGSEFSSSGISLNIRRKNISLRGELRYGSPRPLQSDIMGPLRFLPMECRHGVVSMKHDVAGKVVLNGEELSFDKGTGYIETDSGRSFPEGYCWIQCNDFDQDCSVMASIAKIPFMGLRFWGCICAITLGGAEYRLATYKGAEILRCERGAMELRQGKYHLDIRIDQRAAHSLAAPESGLMSRVIMESVSCPAKFVFTENGRAVFIGGSARASYECAM